MPPSLISVPVRVRGTPIASAAGKSRCHCSGARRQAIALQTRSSKAMANSVAAALPVTRATSASGARATNATAQASASKASA